MVDAAEMRAEELIKLQEKELGTQFMSAYTLQQRQLDQQKAVDRAQEAGLQQVATSRGAEAQNTYAREAPHTCISRIQWL